MAVRIFRVVVRGHFHDLDPEQRANLRAEAPNYEIFKSAYTADGTLTYEPNLVAFSFRYEIRDSNDAPDGAAERVMETAMAKARASLEVMGVDHRHLRRDRDRHVDRLVLTNTDARRSLVAPCVQTEQLSKRYGHTVALDQLDLEIETGEVFGYLGPNGAGKSTTISLLLGVIRPSGGSAHILGLDAWRDAPAVHRRLAYVPSDATLWPSLTGAEVLRFLGSIHGSVDEPYRDELVGRFELTADKKMRAYSHGNRQKVLLIAALASRADLILLDEPTSGLDPLMEEVFRDCIREARDRGQTVLLSSHILSEVEAVCDRVAMLRAGTIIETGRLDVLRGLAALHVRAEVTSAPPDLHGLDGVTNVVIDGTTVECDVKGSMQPLMAALADAGIQRITTEEPSLEELFISHYGESPVSPAGVR